MRKGKRKKETMRGVGRRGGERKRSEGGGGEKRMRKGIEDDWRSEGEVKGTGGRRRGEEVN